MKEIFFSFIYPEIIVIWGEQGLSYYGKHDGFNMALTHGLTFFLTVSSLVGIQTLLCGLERKEVCIFPNGGYRDVCPCLSKIKFFCSTCSGETTRVETMIEWE